MGRGRPKQSLEQKIRAEMPEFVDEVNALSSGSLELRLAGLAKNNDEVEQAQSGDLALEKAKASASELAAPYRDAKKAIKLKSRYIISLIREKGGQ